MSFIPKVKLIERWTDLGTEANDIGHWRGYQWFATFEEANRYISCKWPNNLTPAIWKVRQKTGIYYNKRKRYAVTW